MSVTVEDVAPSFVIVATKNRVVMGRDCGTRVVEGMNCRIVRNRWGREYAVPTGAVTRVTETTWEKLGWKGPDIGGGKL